MFSKPLTLSFTLIFAMAAVVVGQHNHGMQYQPMAKRSQGKRATIGVLLLAHGGQETWNAEVKKIAAAVDSSMPVEVAFGMATKRNIQSAVDRLIERGVTEIVAVPLFVSSNSSVITSTEFLLGLRKVAPPALSVFAKMDHGDGGHGSHMAGNMAVDPTTPITSRVPVRMTPALNSHPIVANILGSRALSISKDPANEVVVLVAHGPVSDFENKLWLADMASLANGILSRHPFKRIEYLTVRDDAPEEVRSMATAQLRKVVGQALREGDRVLIDPLLLSYGGIELGIKERLKGLEYAMPEQALLPDDRIVRWVLESAQAR